MSPEQEYEIMWKVYLSFKERVSELPLYAKLIVAPTKSFKLAVVGILRDIIITAYDTRTRV